MPPDHPRSAAAGEAIETAAYRGIARVALRIVGMALILPGPGCAVGPDLEAETAELLRLHEQLLEAHRSGDVDRWMAVESEEMVSVNGGTITFPTIEERRAVRTSYLGSTTFTVYRDLRPPIVRVSADGTVGWLAAEVEVRGTRSTDGSESAVDADWAWIEVYEKRSGAWRLVANASNRRR